MPVIVHPADAPRLRRSREPELGNRRQAGRAPASQWPCRAATKPTCPRPAWCCSRRPWPRPTGCRSTRRCAPITIDAAKILGIEDRVGSLEVGKDGDVALYDGDPFEYTTHCTGCVIEGEVVSEIKR